MHRAESSHSSLNQDTARKHESGGRASTTGPAIGQELESIGDVDGDYGTTDSTLDMAKLFRTLPEVAGYGGNMSVKTEQGNMGG